MGFDTAFAGLATAFAERFGAPLHDAEARWPGVPIYDAGGSIITPATPIVRTCKAQVDAATETMRADAGFLATDMRIIVLAATLASPLDTAAKIVVLAGPHQGTWALMSVSRDPAGIGYECRGRLLP